MFVIQLYNSDKKACTSVLDIDGNSLKRMYYVCKQLFQVRNIIMATLYLKGILKSG